MKKHKLKKFLSKTEYIKWKIENRKERTKEQIEKMLNNQKLTFYMINGVKCSKFMYESGAGKEGSEGELPPLPPKERRVNG